MGYKLQSTHLELEENINKLAAMKVETSRIRALNQGSVYRCEHLESILEEKTSLIRKYQQSSSRVYQNMEETARVARKQMEDLQAVLVQAVANAQQEVEEMQKATDISVENATSRNSQREGSLSSNVSESIEM